MPQFLQRHSGSQGLFYKFLLQETCERGEALYQDQVDLVAWWDKIPLIKFESIFPQ
jgi:hypothetical protein